MSLFLRKIRIDHLSNALNGHLTSINTKNYLVIQVLATFQQLELQHDDNAKSPKIAVSPPNLDFRSSNLLGKVYKTNTCILGSISAGFPEVGFLDYNVVNFQTALENMHLLPNWLNGAFLRYPASETCITEPGRGEKGYLNCPNLITLLEFN